MLSLWSFGAALLLFSFLNLTTAATSDYWVANIPRQGKVAFGDQTYQVFRNVLDFGAKGSNATIHVLVTLD